MVVEIWGITPYWFESIVVIYGHYSPIRISASPFVDITRGFGGEKQSRVGLGVKKPGEGLFKAIGR